MLLQDHERKDSDIMEREGNGMIRMNHFRNVRVRAEGMLIAAVIIAAAVLSGCSPAVPASTMRQPGRLSRITMVTTQDGWVITTGDLVLVTSNGGAKWTDVTPFQPVLSDGEATPIGTCFFNASTAFVGVPTDADHSTPTTILRTVDTGRSWDSAQLPKGTSWEKDDTSGLFISFSDVQHGYVLVTSSPGLGQMAKALYKTVDGGRSFRFVKDVTGLTDEKGVFSGIEGYPTGMAFSSEMTGFVTCTYRGQANPQIYSTTDGGANWHLASQKIQAETPYQLSFPAGEKRNTEDTNGYIDAYSPLFFGSGRQTGCMLLDRRINDTGTLQVYRTADGGTTWTVAETMGNPSLHACSFIDSRNGYGIDDKGALFATADGGTTWQAVPAESNGSASS